MVTVQNRTSDVADGHPIAVVGNHSELVREVLFLDDRLDGAVGEAVGGNWLQEEPARDEALGVGRCPH